MAHQSRCIFLTGAPISDELDWTDSVLLSDFTIGENASCTNDTRSSPQPTPSWQAPVWRAIALTPERSKASFQELPTHFLSFGDKIPDLDIATKQDFLEHSIALIDGLASSQIAPTDLEGSTFLDYTNLSFVSDTSLHLTDTSEIAQSPKKQPVNINLPVTDIRQIPSASHILSISPQTITLNLLCAVISVSQPRTVTLRRRQRSNNGRPNTMEILDLLVGDDTRAGFSISFWLPPVDSQKSHANDSEDLRLTLQTLRAGDVVLVTNVALSVWRGAVYGQSLGKRWARNSTRVAKIEDAEVERGLSVGVKGKLAKVRSWREDFVGRDASVRRSTRVKASKRKREEELPPDTQD